ncbi:MAG TPA: envelope stress response membrane protein PspB [Sphingomonas sp.]|jgi:phage shock protein B
MTPIIICAILFVGLPWVILHYVTKWKQAPKITQEDENLLDEMYQLARRLEGRVEVVERIVAADNPEFNRGLTGSPSDYRPSLDKPRTSSRFEGMN